MSALLWEQSEGSGSACVLLCTPLHQCWSECRGLQAVWLRCGLTNTERQGETDSEGEETVRQIIYSELWKSLTVSRPASFLHSPADDGGMTIQATDRISHLCFFFFHFCCDHLSAFPQLSCFILLTFLTYVYLDTTGTQWWCRSVSKALPEPVMWEWHKMFYVCKHGEGVVYCPHDDALWGIESNQTATSTCRLQLFILPDYFFLQLTKTKVWKYHQYRFLCKDQQEVTESVTNRDDK